MCAVRVVLVRVGPRGCGVAAVEATARLCRGRVWCVERPECSGMPRRPSDDPKAICPSASVAVSAFLSWLLEAAARPSDPHRIVNARSTRSAFG
mmetsp:Transcript_12353/g.49781  ORF Transcript_12353/g.49781 Transcript_12353/m.49781 type:complete len:94 (-) Transcript_12353:520-801(-)